mmetsp:Transcript_4315/g.13022  ORF Transcript_4315/g.13022 Transcript_4315/m.13022 type:complete len:263 (-) Transcript_4315:393-1181(-)
MCPNLRDAGVCLRQHSCPVKSLALSSTGAHTPPVPVAARVVSRNGGHQGDARRRKVVQFQPLAGVLQRPSEPPQVAAEVVAKLRGHGPAGVRARKVAHVHALRLRLPVSSDHVCSVDDDPHAAAVEQHHQLRVVGAVRDGKGRPVHGNLLLDAELREDAPVHGRGLISIAVNDEHLVCGQHVRRLAEQPRDVEVVVAQYEQLCVGQDDLVQPNGSPQREAVDLCETERPLLGAAGGAGSAPGGRLVAGGFAEERRRLLLRHV